MTREDAIHEIRNANVTLVSKEAKEIAIKALEQEPKTGHWEWVQYDANPEIGNFHCSECRYIPAIFNMSDQKLNYCPKCGAKMAEGEE